MLRNHPLKGESLKTERRNGFQNRRETILGPQIHLLLNCKESTGALMFVAKTKGSRKILA